MWTVYGLRFTLAVDPCASIRRCPLWKGSEGIITKKRLNYSKRMLLPSLIIRLFCISIQCTQRCLANLPGKPSPGRVCKGPASHQKELTQPPADLFFVCAFLSLPVDPPKRFVFVNKALIGEGLTD